MSQDQYPQQPPAQPQYAAPQPGYVAPAVDPGRGMGIAGLILGFFGPVALVGLILSILARSKSKKAGFNNGIALAGIIVSAIVLVVTIVISIVVGIAIANAATELAQACAGHAAGDIVTVGGVMYQCP